MLLIRTVPQLGGLLDLCSYECWVCGVYFIAEATERS